MNLTPESRRQLRRFYQELSEKLGAENLDDHDVRMKPKASEMKGTADGIPRWALGIGHIITTIGKGFSENVIEAFGEEFKTVIGKIYVRFSRTTESADKKSTLDFKLGQGSQPDLSQVNTLVDKALVQELYASAKAVNDNNGKIIIFIVDPETEELVSADFLLPLTENKNHVSNARGKETLKSILDNKQLPIVPNSVHHLRQLAFNPRVSLSEIMPLVMEDPVLTLNILRFANAPSRRRHDDITNIQTACNMIGPRHVVGIAFGLALRVQNTAKATTFNADHFWAASAARAATAWRIAKSVPGIEPQDAYTAGLLCKIGTLAMATVYPDDYDLFQDLSITKTEQTLAEIEKSIFGVNHADISASIVNHWHMPPWFCEAISLHLYPYTSKLEGKSELVANIIATACQVASIFMGPKKELLRENVHAVVKYGEYFGLSESKFEIIFAESIEEWQETCCVYKAPHKPVPAWCEVLEEVG